MTILSAQFTEDIRSTSQKNSDLLNAFRTDFTKIESQICSDSVLSTQLQACKASYECLKESLESVQPILNQLGTSAPSLTATQESLILDLKRFREELEESRVPAGNPVLEMELSSKFAENTQLQLRVHDMSSEMDNLRKQLEEVQTQSHQLHQSFSESESKRRAAEERNQQLKDEQAALKSEIDSIGQRIRDEAEKTRSIAMDQLAVQHQAEIEALQKQKNEMEHASAEVAAKHKAQCETEIRRLQKDKDDVEHSSARIAAQLKAEYDNEIGSLRKHKEDTEHACVELTAQLSGVQECMVRTVT